MTPAKPSSIGSAPQAVTRSSSWTQHRAYAPQIRPRSCRPLWTSPVPWSLPASNPDAHPSRLRLHFVHPQNPRPSPERQPPARRDFGAYGFHAFDDVAAMHAAIFRRNAEACLARMVAGFAWEWKSKRDAAMFDIEIGVTRLRWNSIAKDWITSANSLEVGSMIIDPYSVGIRPELRWRHRQA
ncbi:Alcohol oxidase [Mycena sanguinolenta]|uniref:Alcohol oxidase n=1 Tax=Mycena sanguinolenta TaxID=230812 RepID=A0A8H6ZDA7_9AGAR|nr:Alcohol oxidase [Mycena sanguinolenta]